MKTLYTFLLCLTFVFTTKATGPIVANCTPSTTSYNSCCDFGILNVTFNTINKTTLGGADGYKDYSGTVNTNVLAGAIYSISVNVNGASPAKQNVKAWIDYNNNGKLDSINELVFTATSVLTTVGTIFIPATAIRNTALRMRVAADYDLSPALTPCKNQQYGQAEDYSITILDNPNPPNVAFHADNVYSCSGTVKFTDDSQNIPTSWLWNFGDGQTSTSKNPNHTYNTNGTYKVKLKATNSHGTDTDSIVNYIIVTLGAGPVAASCSPKTLAYCCQYGITNVTFNTINNTTVDANEGYKDFSCAQKTNVNKGQAYSISITTGGVNSHDVRVWIDYNNDGIFSNTTELAFTKNNQVSPSGTITIPSTGVTLNTPLRMRVFADYAGGTTTPCTTPSYGQIEDYNVMIKNPSAIDETEFQKSLVVFPNPSNGNITISFKLASPEKISIFVYDVDGREVYSKNISNTIEYNETINLSQFTKGLYCVKVMTEGEQAVKTIMIE